MYLSSSQNKGKLSQFDRNTLQNVVFVLIQSANALMYDAVHVFAHALEELLSIEGFQLGKPSCNRPRAWPAGERIMAYMKQVGGTRFPRYEETIKKKFFFSE